MAILNTYITLKEAADISGYHSDYIGALVRSGKVAGIKKGKNWYVSKKDFDAYLMTKNYVPAKKAIFLNRTFGFLVFIFLAIIVGGFIFLETSLASLGAPKKPPQAQVLDDQTSAIIASP